MGPVRKVTDSVATQALEDTQLEDVRATGSVEMINPKP